MPEESTQIPITIVGAGPLGLATALALARHGHSVGIFDARPEHGNPGDQRMLALSQGSRDLLELLDAWPKRYATPITHVHVSQAEGVAQTCLSAEEQHVPALGYVVSAQALQDSLLHQAQARKINITYESHVKALPDSGHYTVQPNGAPAYTASTRLLVFCEGGVPEADSDLRHDYAQHALLCLAHPTQPHGNWAYERFTRLGPLALLPSGQDYAVVWSIPSSQKDFLLQSSDQVWLDHLNPCLPSGIQLQALHGRADYPLGLRMRQKIVGPRCVWLGNAAQTLHPVAGQGFNLALRDAWTLADTLVRAEDPGCTKLLDHYACSRSLDRTATARFTDLLAWGFASRAPGLVALRDLGLMALETLPPLRHFLGQRMIFGARAWP